MIKKSFFLILPFLLLFSGCDEAWDIMIEFNLVDDGGSDHSDPTDDYTNYTLAGGYPDLDLDGIPDVAELPNTKFEDMPLYDWGARPAQRDLFIHVATMEVGDEETDGGLLLQKNALDKVVAAFAAQEIAVHFDVGSKGLYEGYSESSSDTYNLSDRDNQVPYAKSIQLSESVVNQTGANPDEYVFVNDYKDEYFPSKRENIFYFLVIGSSQEEDGSGGSSGISWLNGVSFLVTLADWDYVFGDGWTIGGIEMTAEQMKNRAVNGQAATIMHEFGHILGLKHGGNINENYKPNYYSIMNYLYQIDGLPEIGNNEGDRYYKEQFIQQYYYNGNTNTSWKDFVTYSSSTNWYMNDYALINGPYTSTFKIDYSHGDGGSLDESGNLNENLGLNQISSNSIDWNASGSIESGVEYDINYSWTKNNYTNDSTTVLQDYDDWSNLYYYFANRTAGKSRNIDENRLEVEFEEKPLFLPTVIRK